ncbi:hypothetical protein [Flavobacterium sp.]|uniref:hypothetical protein n=1 Tax=Flavobacterium sp. TaxID=239 RepID=UPI0031E44761
MKKLFIILTIFTFLACNSNDDNRELKPKESINTSIDFSVFNAQGEDLLDSKNANHIDSDKIKLFYVINGNTKELVHNPKSQLIYVRKDNNINACIMRVVMNDIEKVKKSITYIQWNEKETDTIEATYVRGKNYIFPKEVWVNGALISNDVKYGETAYVVLTK